MPNRAVRQHQVDENYDAFLKLLPDILQAHAGKFALMREREVVDYFDSFGDAVRFGNEKYPDGNFSIQEVNSGSAKPKPIVEIGVSVPIGLSPQPPPINWVRALVDTGCSHTSVTSALAQTLGLNIVGRGNAHNAQSTAAVNLMAFAP